MKAWTIKEYSEFHMRNFTNKTVRYKDALDTYWYSLSF